MSTVPSPWNDACLAADLIAVDPAGLGGVLLRAQAGPARDAWLARWRGALPTRDPVHAIPLSVDDSRLLGGVDLTATLNAGRPVMQQGLLAQAAGGTVVLAMAERIARGTAARVAAALDDRDRPIAAIACDEGGADEHVPSALAERLGLQVDLAVVTVRELATIPSTPVDRIIDARERIDRVAIDDALVEALCAAALALGIGSLRAPTFAVRASRAIAALDGRDAVMTEDAARAARLVLSSRARVVPQPPVDEEPAPEQAPSEPQQSEDRPEDHEPQPTRDEPLDDVVLDAAVAAIPAGLIEQLARGAHSHASRAMSASGAGAATASRHRGAPIGARRRRPRGHERLALIDTLRAAVPWQRVRRAEHGSAARIQVRADDLHVVRFKERHPTTTVFVVDASGSSALHRLAEAKGAVELLLADCYVRRDSVAVIAFRGRDAQIVLPPTRSLARARRSLAGLPGGGGTPLAHALDATRELIIALRRRGDTALAVLLTDGRANVARDGNGGRERAEVDALAAARSLRAIDADVVLIDTSPQPHERAARIAAAMNATYRALPHAGAREMSAAVLDATRIRA